MSLTRQFVSYPKSGRSWIRYALTTLSVAHQVRFPARRLRVQRRRQTAHDLDFDQRLKKYSRIDRVVYMSRDPRDLMVSLYIQITGRFRDFFGYRESISEFIRDDYFGAHNLLGFRRIWERVCAGGHALEISYEACHEDFVAVLARVTEYYGFAFTLDQLRAASAAASFDNMKRIEQSGRFPGPWLRPRQGGSKVRRGVVGGYSKYLAPGDVAYLDRLFELDDSPAAP